MAAYHPTTRGQELCSLLAAIYETLTSDPLWNEPVETKDNLGETQRDQTNIQFVSPEEERKPTLIQMGVYNLRHRGALNLAMQIWVFIRRPILFGQSHAGNLLRRDNFASRQGSP